MKKNSTDNLIIAMQKLKKSGYKYTKKREEILSFMIQENRYLSAKEIFEYMQNNYKGLSYDTIYRNLKDFILLNLVEETDLKGEKRFRFDCCYYENIGHHHHFICLECGATKEISMCPMNYFKDQLVDCERVGHRFEIYGICDKCK